jgi:hypothetical protein
VTAERRLAKLEAALSPTELVLRWLDEAHAFGDLESYVRSQLAEPTFEGPLDRLAREASASATATARGKGAEARNAAIRTARRETVFRFELVLRIIVTTYEVLDRERLLAGLLSAHLALLADEGPAARHLEVTYLERLAARRDLAVLRFTELRAAEEARETAEVRYLAGHPALFAEALKAWDEQLAMTASIADLANSLAELDGLPVIERPDPDAVAERVARLTADLVEPAKVTALEKLGEGERALGIATAWMRGKFGGYSPPEAAAR